MGGIFSLGRAFRWMQYTKLFPSSLSPSLSLPHSLDLHELDHCLGPYPYNVYKKWLSLTNNITESLIQRYMINSSIPVHNNTLCKYL